MAKRIFCLEILLPGKEFEFIDFDSDQTLLDADIVLFEPTLGSYGYQIRSQHLPNGRYMGRPILEDSVSFAAATKVKHWHSEIVAAVNAGKLVIIYLVKPTEYYRSTGEKRTSGTGRNQQVTNIVTEISSYNAVPIITKVLPKSGSKIRLEKDAAHLASYWREFSKCSPYEVEIEGEFSNILLRSSSGNKIVGAAVYEKNGGCLLFLPPLRLDEEKFFKGGSERDDGAVRWTAEGLKFGKRLLAEILAVSDAVRQDFRVAPPPDWTLDSSYQLEAESKLKTEISDYASKIGELEEKKDKLEVDLESAGTLRRLLFEQGRPLENAILEVMRLFGFEAQPFSNGDSEFDVVFSSPEMRCLGEAEGKDSKAINIDKFSQLERNLHEDFARDEVTEHAKGVLFGNAFRLLPLQERGSFFTEKCISAAKRVGAALVRTPDLFAPARYLKTNPSDTNYAKQCRDAIAECKGTTVVFPPPPVSQID